MTLLEHQAQALRELRRIWAAEEAMLIGASALACFMDYTWHVTDDLDLCVAISVSEVEESVSALADWRPDPVREQRWTSPSGVRVEIVPAGPEHLESREVVWPSGIRLNLTGMRAAFAAGVILDIRPDLQFLVTPAHTNLLLKAVAYSDRPAERHRDLQDIAFILDRGVAANDPDRFGPAVLDRNLTYEETGPFVLGQRLARVIDDVERQALGGFVETALKDEAVKGMMAQYGPALWQGEPEYVETYLNALAQGVLDAPQ